ncbi:MAG: beta-ketoacyl-ACP synthase II [Thermomicrobiales bacterium]|nr:beta-ketoacyl-ACP synthase II [Thermomicrobiales bacterium]MCO5221675.1 beta-ketoacyl-ACP synthase II [Thermomicrobiales bacterium]
MPNESDRRRVVVTGISAISPIGLDAESTWSGLLAGISGVGPITRFDATDFETRFAGEVKGFKPDEILGKKDYRRMDRYCQLGVAAAIAAAEHAGLAERPADPLRTGALIATGMGAIETIETGMETLLDRGPGRIGPFFMPMMLANMASGHVSMRLDAKGPNMATVSACASSAHALGEATRWIRDGMADVVYAGGCEAPVSRLSVAGFNAMGALSRRNDDPAAASRPFDLGRDGFVVGEGAAILVLEELEHARARGATILAEIAGYGATDDANHIVQPSPEGEGAARAMRLALEDAGLTPDEIDYLNAHGTSTPLNEKFETQSIKGAFGEFAASLPISSTKSMTGHLLGAAGALEAAISVLAIRDQIAPPTINYETPDPDCDLDYIPNAKRPLDISAVMSNSMGFGGHNVSLVLAKM